MADIRGLTLADAGYPPRLREIHDPPSPLYVRGALPDATRPHVAVVGTRAPTRYGHDVVESIVTPLARAGVVIVSGLAFGIDALAHRAALEAGGTTLAVLGSRLEDEQIYPATNRPLAARILACGGALMGELDAESAIGSFNFPRRNRIIAGLCQAVLIVEAAKKSGSLITARCAIDEGRDVMAVPGPITGALSEGPNRLIKSGAIPILSAEDVLEALKMPSVIQKSEPTLFVADTPEEEALVKALADATLHADELTRATGLGAALVGSTLTLLEMKGAVKNAGGRYWQRILNP
ncbi:DNA protecting protein DprA [Candidatus Uhrbacteria bacterium RIFCSPHIGHO2_01_FULL_63_20]|uniref:DNA protecting protein DprA n=1 Tax=Candidatus Uhrbacteria bacterium RIFCSPHIGHO2_01_FULL_63_20 TaxID=1802385 RepID=A0A1F7TMG2_9BACT|nr:MAG: DNA protecting protein DprA [Candidatus Uhrbacteria bacterium RIFCSPHIGHO2_01_FULL_63_20]